MKFLFGDGLEGFKIIMDVLRRNLGKSQTTVFHPRQEAGHGAFVREPGIFIPDFTENKFLVGVAGTFTGGREDDGGDIGILYGDGFLRSELKCFFGHVLSIITKRIVSVVPTGKVQISAIGLTGMTYTMVELRHRKINNRALNSDLPVERTTRAVGQQSVR